MALWFIALGLFFAALWLGALVVEWVFPYDPPPLREGETVGSRIGKLHW